MKWLYANYKWLFSGVAGAVLLALIGFVYRLLTKSSRADRNQLAKWTVKWERAADALKKIYPGYVTAQPGTAANAYAHVFSDQLRQRIEHHLGEKVFFTNKFRPRTLSKDDLLNPAVQEVIGEVLEAVEKFKKEHTDWSRALKLSPPL